MKEESIQNNKPLIAYIFVSFPKITETFNLREMLQLRKYGADIEVFSLLTPHTGQVVHPEAQDLVSKTHYCRWFFSLRLWRANLYYLFTCPGTYLKLLWRLIRESARQPLLLGKTLHIFGKSVYFSLLAKRRGVRHIHATFASHNTTCAMIMSTLTGIDFSFTIDAYDLYVDTSLHQQKLTRASFVTTISRYNVNIIEGRYGGEISTKTHHIARGIDLDRYSSGSGTDYVPGEGPFRLVCVASLQIKKGHLYLLEAIATLRSQGRDIRCVLAGEGPLRAKIQNKIAQLGLGEWVTMAGALTQDQVIEQLRRAHCSVLPSIIGPGNRMEGIPNALMEAMACELPVVSTNISGIPELVEEGKTGLLVAPEDSGALAAAIGWLEEHPQQATEFGRAGRGKVRRDYNLDVNILKLWDLYSKDMAIDVDAESC